MPDPDSTVDVRARRVLAILFVALSALATAPGLASAATFTVNSTGDGATLNNCKKATGQCTLRGAIEAADATSSGPRLIGFDPAVFAGNFGDTISPGASMSLPAIELPTTVDGLGCDAGSTVPCIGGANAAQQTLLAAAGDGSVIENLSVQVPADVIAISATGAADRILGDRVELTGTGSGPTATGIAVTGTGVLVESDTVRAAAGQNRAIVLGGAGADQVLGNYLVGSSCPEPAITIEAGAGNQIGGETLASENTIEGFGGGAISLDGNLSPNEIERNHGANGSRFIFGASLEAPLITDGRQARVSGTAQPNALIRVFRKQTEAEGEIEGFLGTTVADGNGHWEVTFPKVPTGIFVAATESRGGATSSLSGVSVLLQEVESAGGTEGAGGGDAGDGPGGGGATSPPPAPGASTPSPPAKPGPSHASAPRMPPRVRVVKAPKRTSGATGAKFVFKPGPTAGAYFECKLDGARWAKCRSPKTYRHLRPGPHTFSVRARIAARTGPVTKYRFRVTS